MKKITRENITFFNPTHTFECGQCFRWEKESDGSYTGIAGGLIANINCKDQVLTIKNSSEEDYEGFWKRYLDLDRDYKQIREYLANKDQVIKKAMEYGNGIRILNQEKWEALVSFIVSANNNIPRIKKNIEGIAKRFGEKAGTYNGNTYYNLPKPSVLASLSEDDLAPIKLGYRSKYLIETAKTVTEEGEVHYEKLRDYCGVGPKVANCISLFSMGRMESFPIDTWVEKVMKQLYGIEKKKDMIDFAEKTFGKYGDWLSNIYFII